ncbi:MAG: 3-hydroxyacyl-CoA dehydrogenase/enoyl-CoA hydratase family protein [Bacteroidia bacterium]
MNRVIKRVAVLGSGVMGSRIACHFANIGVNVLLLDIVPKEATTTTATATTTTTTANSTQRNKIVNDALQAAIKSNPAPLFKKSFAQRITTGNFDDNMKDIANCDWIIEVVIENIDIKKKIFDQVEKYRTNGTLITSNTSGIPIHLMLEGRSDDFQQHFCGTHFFNPPRYLRLLEIIPTAKTKADVVSFLMHYGDLYLGKTTVLCKDTPAFIANRIGVFSIMNLFHQVQAMGFTVEEIDKLTGPVLGRPKSATFRTCDVVGLDTLVLVANNLHNDVTDETERKYFELPAFIQKMIDNKWLGDKTKQGFYKKVKGESGSEILSLDLKTLEYKPQVKSKFATLEQTKGIDNIRDRIKVLASGKDKAGEFYRSSFIALFNYVSTHVPEIADEIYRVDDALKAGFGWELGPFELWDSIGVKDAIAMMKSAGKPAAAWVEEMIATGADSFYKIDNGIQSYYDQQSKSYKPVPGQQHFIVLDNLRNKTLWKNAGCSLLDIGDGILNLEFHTKMNTIGGEIVEGILKSIEIAEKDFRGLTVGNDGANFSAGANLGLIYMMALEEEWDEIDMAIRMFQKMNMRVRYSSIPVVVAPHALALGGGCEMSLHADRVQAAAETYIGLVEFGVGLIPGGGGTKEFAMRFADSLKEGDIELNALRERFLTIAQAKVSTSAAEAFDLGILRPGIDAVTMNQSRLLHDAKNACIELAEEGYVQPVQRKDIRVLGKSGLGMVYAGANAMYSGNYMSEHDKIISEKLGYVMCGGDLSAPALVSEQYLLDLEREAFLSLCGMRKTLERIKSILTSGKILRN